MKISIIGLGFVGLVTATCLANKGFKVYTTTGDSKKRKKISNGIPPFFEPKLGKELTKAVKSGQLEVVETRNEAVRKSDATFISVGTPSLKGGGVNLNFLRDCCNKIGTALRNKDSRHLVVLRSTVPPGTTRKIAVPILTKNSHRKVGRDILICFSPEFLREGNALFDTLYPDRVVIGEFNKPSGDQLEEIYKEFYKGSDIPFVRTNLETAELAKYACNCFLATKISFINEIAQISERTPGVNIETIANIMGLDNRISSKFLRAGVGFGGSCFPKDIKGLIAYSKELNYEPNLIRAVIEQNKKQHLRVIELAEDIVGDLGSKNIAILGLAFKPNTDDMREAPSIDIIQQLMKKNVQQIAVYDPAATTQAKSIFENLPLIRKRIRYSKSISECLEGADVCFLVTEWKEFSELKPNDFIKKMKAPILIDGRRVFRPEKFNKQLRFRAIGLGIE